MTRILFIVCLVLTASEALGGSYEDMILAAQKGDMVNMEYLMDRGLDPNSTDRDGNSLLTIAITQGSEPLVEFLIRRKAKLEGLNRNGETALQLAAFKGQVGVVKRLLAAGARVDNRGAGWPAIVYATIGGHFEVLKLLVEAKADLDVLASNGMTALMFAIQSDREEMARLLIEAGANPDIATHRGETAYSLSLISGEGRLTPLIESALTKFLARSQASTLVNPPERP